MSLVITTRSFNQHDLSLFVFTNGRRKRKSPTYAVRLPGQRHTAHATMMTKTSSRSLHSNDYFKMMATTTSTRLWSSPRQEGKTLMPKGKHCPTHTSPKTSCPHDRPCNVPPARTSNERGAKPIRGEERMIREIPVLKVSNFLRGPQGPQSSSAVPHSKTILHEQQLA